MRVGDEADAAALQATGQGVGIAQADVGTAEHRDAVMLAVIGVLVAGELPARGDRACPRPPGGGPTREDETRPDAG